MTSDFNSYFRKNVRVELKPLLDDPELIEWTPSTGYLTENSIAFPYRIRKAINDYAKIILSINKSNAINLCPGELNSIN